MLFLGEFGHILYLYGPRLVPPFDLLAIHRFQTGHGYFGAENSVECRYAGFSICEGYFYIR